MDNLTEKERARLEKAVAAAKQAEQEYNQAQARLISARAKIDAVMDIIAEERGLESGKHIQINLETGGVEPIAKP